MIANKKFFLLLPLLFLTIKILAQPFAILEMESSSVLNVTDSDQIVRIRVEIVNLNPFEEYSVYPYLIIQLPDRNIYEIGYDGQYLTAIIPKGTPSCNAKYSAYVDFYNPYFPILPTSYSEGNITIINDSLPNYPPKDSIPPELISFKFDTTIVDITDGPKNLNWVAEFSDDSTGYASIQCEYSLPSNGFYSDYYFNSTNQKKNVILNGNIPIISGRISGTGYLRRMRILDFADNVRIYDSIDLANLGIDIDFTIINNSYVDTFPPILDSLQFLDTLYIEPNQDAYFLKMELKATDWKGVELVFLEYLNEYGYKNNIYFKKGDGPSNNAVWKVNAALYTQELMTSKSFSLILKDSLSNIRRYNPEDLQSLGYNSNFTIIKRDTVPPEIIDISFNQDTINIQSQKVVQYIYVHVKDSLSSIKNIYVNFVTSAGRGYYSNLKKYSDFEWGSNFEIHFDSIHPLIEKVSIHSLGISDNSRNSIEYDQIGIDTLGLKSFFVLKYSDQTLPIKFISFKVDSEKDKILFKWSIFADEPIKKFVIEYSQNGTEWIAIGESIEINSLQTNFDYSYSGQSTTGYFRIAAYNEEEKVTYSQVIFADNLFNELKIYPNPCYDKLFFENSSKFSLNYTIYNIYGSVLVSGKTDNNFIDTSKLSEGQYIINIFNDSDKWKPKKFLKVEK